MDDRVELGVDLLDAGDGSVDQLGRGHRAGAHEVRLVGCVHAGEVVGHEPPPIVAACGLGSSCSSGCPALARPRSPPPCRSPSRMPASSTRTRCVTRCSTHATTRRRSGASASRPCLTPPAIPSGVAASSSSMASPPPRGKPRSMPLRRSRWSTPPSSPPSCGPCPSRWGWRAVKPRPAPTSLPTATGPWCGVWQPTCRSRPATISPSTPRDRSRRWRRSRSDTSKNPLSRLSAMLPDYATYDEAIGLDWYDVDPNLRLILDRLLPEPGERALAEELVAEYGPLVGGPIARRAEVTDKNGPVLQRWD